MPKRSTPDRPTYTEVARRLGLSVSAVSLTARDPRTPRVSPAVRARIIAALGHGAPATAAPLVLVTADATTLAQAWCGALLAGAQAAARTHGRALQVEVWDDGLIGRLTAAGAAGTLLALPLAAEELAPLQARLPCVMVNDVAADAACDTVESDDREALRLAVAHLAAAGALRLAYLGWEHPGLPAAAWRWGRQHAEREAGFREACATLGLAAEVRLLTARHRPDRPPLRLPEVLAAWAAAPPEGVACFDDNLALELLAALRAAGRPAPPVIGCNDQPEAARHDPPLSSIDVGLRQLGAEAATLLCRRLAGESGPPRRVLCRPRLVARGAPAGISPPPPRAG